MSHCISASNIRADRLLALNGVQEHACPKGDKCSKTPFSYGYETGANDEIISDTPLFKLQIAQGRVIRNRHSKDKLKLILTLKDQNDIKGLSQLSKGFALVIEKHKSRLGMPRFKADTPGDLRGAYFYQYDPCICEPIEGALPYMDLKIDYRSIFQVPFLSGDKIKYKKIKAEDLLDKNITCSVIINPSHLTRYGGMPLPQIFVKSCIVLDIKQIEVEHTLDESISTYLKYHRERIEILNSILDKEEEEECLPVTPPNSVPQMAPQLTSIPSFTSPSLPTGGINLNALLSSQPRLPNL